MGKFFMDGERPTTAETKRGQIEVRLCVCVWRAVAMHDKQLWEADVGKNFQVDSFWHKEDIISFW